MRFYVYVLLRPDGRPFYVGKGQRDRILEHEGEARRGHNCHKCKIIRKVWREGGNIQRQIVFRTHEEQEALAYERELIALYGRDKLCNQTDGGEGPSNISDEVRSRMGESIRKALAKPEWRINASARMKAQWKDPVTANKRRSGINLRNAKPEVKEKRSNASRKVWAKNRDSILEAMRSAEHPNASEGQKKRYESHEERMTQSIRSRKAWADPDKRARQSAIVKAIWADPEKRVKMLAARKRK